MSSDDKREERELVAYLPPAVAVRSDQNEALPSLGRGWNSISGSFQGFAVEPASVGELIEAGTTASVSVVSNKYELFKSLHVHASASFDTFGAGGSVDLDFLKTHTFDSYTICIVARVDVLHGGRALTAFDLTEPARHEVVARGKQAYYDKFGDEFVESVTYGGQLCLMYFFHGETVRDFEQMQLTIKAEAGAWSGAVGVTKTLQETNLYERAELALFAPGYVDQLPDATDKAKVMAFVNDFPSLIKNAGEHEKHIAYFASLPATKCTDWPHTATMDLHKPRRRLHELAELRAETEKLQGAMTFVLANPGMFESPDIAALGRGVVGLKALLRKIDDIATELLLKPWQDEEKADLELDAFYKLLPAARTFDRPAIRAAYTLGTTGARVFNTIVNTGVDFDKEPWIGRAGDQWASLNSLVLALERPIAGTRLQYKIGTLNGITTDWIDAADSVPAVLAATPMAAPITRLAFRMHGDLAAQYDVKFKFFLAGGAKIGPFDGGDDLQGRATTIEAVCLQVKPRIANPPQKNAGH